jgi:hypothetical protein
VSADHGGDGGPGGPRFWVGVVVGWAVMVVAAGGVVRDGWLGDRPLDVARWVVGTGVVHDAVLLPAVASVGWLLGRLLPSAVRGPVRGTAAVSGMVVLFAYPLWRGFGRREANRSILPLDYAVTVAAVVTAVWAVGLVVIVVRVARIRARAR